MLNPKILASAAVGAVVGYMLARGNVKGTLLNFGKQALGPAIPSGGSQSSTKARD